MLTFGEAKSTRELVSAAGGCGAGSDFRSYLNQATRILMKRGNFWGTVQPIQVCVANQCIVWPRYVGTVLAINMCGHPRSLWNNWYSFVPLGPGGIKGDGFGWNGSACSGNIGVDNGGTTPVFNQVPCGKNFYIRAYPSVRADVGKTITIFGIDSNGQEIRTKNADGSWSAGVKLTVAIPFTSTPLLVREITRVVKDKTQGVLRLFQYDPENDVLLDCAAYEPSETTPDYRTSKINGFTGHGCCNCSGIKSIHSLVKLEFIPVEADTDLVIIGNIDALGEMIQAIRAGEAGNAKKKAAFEADAIRDLNLELRDKYPLEQTPISINPFGTALPSGRARIGRII